MRFWNQLIVFAWIIICETKMLRCFKINHSLNYYLNWRNNIAACGRDAPDLRGWIFDGIILVFPVFTTSSWVRLYLLGNCSCYNEMNGLRDLDRLGHGWLHYYSIRKTYRLSRPISAERFTHLEYIFTFQAVIFANN